MRLRTRVLAALLVVAVVLSLVSLAGFTFYRDEVIAQGERDLVTTAESVADRLDTVLDEKEEMVFLWSHRPGIGDHGSASQQVALRTFVATTDFSGASVIARNGTMTAIDGVGIEREEDIEGQNFSDRQYFQRAMRGETYVSDPVRAESDNVVVTVSAPIVRAEQTLGTFNAAFHVQRGDLPRTLGVVTDETEHVVVEADGTTVFETGDPPADAAMRATATVENTGWTVVATSSDAALAAELRTVTLLQLGTLAAVVVSIAALGGWLYREYVHNFERLVAGFGALVVGDYGTTVSLSGSTEWQEVGDHFNELSETLARRRVEVAVLNRVLRHNLRNAMTVVTGNADYLADHVEDDRLADVAMRIRDRSESLLALAERARTVESTLRGGGRAPPSRPVADVVEETVAGLREEHPEATITVERAPPGVAVPGGDLVSVAVDELVANAIDHGGGTVRIAADADEEAVSIVVADDGPGMPVVERRILEESFVESSTEHGSGLGMWIVTWIVDRLDGDVSVDVDAGTTITVRLPLADGIDRNDVAIS
ncbi:sensor histidine kinase [Halomicrobium urmianum]|uniref:sensor histidine kinase n=1 Tax=Halomicrobium urmianum TaxID=1586233 RepID=UPI001CD9DB9B|nr:sensor histidine kinase [Halomicrobium urmianum]